MAGPLHGASRHETGKLPGATKKPKPGGFKKKTRGERWTLEISEREEMRDPRIGDAIPLLDHGLSPSLRERSQIESNGWQEGRRAMKPYGIVKGMSERATE